MFVFFVIIVYDFLKCPRCIKINFNQARIQREGQSGLGPSN